MFPLKIGRTEHDVRMTLFYVTGEGEELEARADAAQTIRSVPGEVEQKVFRQARGMRETRRAATIRYKIFER